MSVLIEPAKPSPPSRSDVPTEPIWRIRVEQYHEMLRAGILHSGDPVELLEGWLVQKMTKNPPHVLAGRLLRNAIDKILPEGWDTTSQDPVTLEDSEPEPDLTVVRGEPRDYADHHPTSRDIALIVEIADASLVRDQRLKQRIYARAGIAEYWILNLPDRRIEAYTDPTGPVEQPEYRTQQSFSTGESVPVQINGQVVGVIAVDEVLP